jgi:hypothetical protein
VSETTPENEASELPPTIRRLSERQELARSMRMMADSARRNRFTWRVGVQHDISILTTMLEAAAVDLDATDDVLNKYQRAVWFLQDIAAMSRKIGSETAAHALAQLGEPRERDGE